MIKPYSSRIASFLLVSGLAVNLAGCSDDPAATNHAPAAKITAAATATLGKPIALDGSGSSDADGDKLTYAWTIKTAPAGSTAKLDKVDAIKPSFTPDKAGDYAIALVVSDGKDKSAEASAAVKASAAANQKPVANAGAAAAVAIGETAKLDGSKSTDADTGDVLTYAWTLKAPATSTAALDSATSATPSFKADLAGEYTATLVVSDGKDSSDPASVKITASANHKPVADAGAGFVSKVAQEITLDGSKSSDADKDAITFAWTLDTKPPTSASTLKNATTDKPSFTPDKAGSYLVSLVADDGKSKSDKVTIEIIAQDGALKPVAKIAIPASPKIATDVVLDGSTSLAPKGATAVTLTYAWTLKTKPTGSTAALPATPGAKPTFKADLEGKYTFELKVNDGTTDSDVASADATFIK